MQFLRLWDRGPRFLDTGPLCHGCLLPPSVSVRETAASQHDRALRDLIQRRCPATFAVSVGRKQGTHSAHAHGEGFTWQGEHRTRGDWDVLESVHSGLQGPPRPRGPLHGGERTRLDDDVEMPHVGPEV